ncbi:MAG: hypothetical protein HRT44_07935 [Bdellovibrionales bacterium]|nr:hypothetical protein [Bdellovibrionales bacterium]
MKISHPVTCDRLLRPKLRPENQELWCIALTESYDYIHHKALFQGYIPRFPQCVRKITQFSLKLNSSRIIVVSSYSTHPIIPEEKELFWTEKLQETLKLIEIQLLDHILISPHGHLSLLHWEPQIFDSHSI